MTPLFRSLCVLKKLINVYALRATSHHMNTSNLSAIKHDLSRMITGNVLDAQDLGFANTVAIDNSRITLQPYLVAIPDNTQDVAAILRYCTQHQIKLTTRSGGHSAAGYCLNDAGIVLDTVRLNEMTSVDRGAGLLVGAGTRWINAYNFLRDQQSDDTVIGGGCAGVGIAGFVLGGGYSFISRSYGLGCDNVEGLKVVTAKGDVLQLNDRSAGKENDLYWALRGGGGGNFGIVTEIQLRLHRPPEPRLMMGQVSFPFYKIDEILEFYNGWVLKLPNEMAVYGMLRQFPDRRQGGAPILNLRFTPVYNGPFSKGIELLKPLTELKPDSVELYSMSLPEWENFIGTQTQIRGHAAYMRSLVLAENSLTSEVSTILKKYMSRAPSADSYVVWTHTGGKIKELNNGSYAHRDGAFTFELKSVWDDTQPLLARTNIDWAVRFYDELGKHAQGAYINYIDPLLLNWQDRYYGKNYERLLQVKKEWDPAGQFDFQQGIGSSYQPSRNTPLDLSPLTTTF
jgi:hypothetical protein